MNNLVNIKQQLVSSRSQTSSGTNPCNYITIHETANTTKGAGAQAHANLQSRGNSRQASWHYQVDDKEIIQSFPDNVRCWHTANVKGNNESIGIEICVNPDSDFKKAVANAADLVRFLMAKHDIPLINVVQHNHWSGKNCPRYIRSGEKGVNWKQFLAMVTSVEKEVPKQSETTTVEQAKQHIEKTKAPYQGNSIVDYLNSLGIDSSTSNRKKLATQYGVKNYDLSAAKNLELLGKMRKGKPVSKPPQKSVNKPISSLPSGVIRQGAKGTNVRIIQQALASVYFYPEKGAKNNGVDGIYGPKTADAVKRFQSMNGLTQDGIYGPQTKKALEKVMIK